MNDEPRTTLADGTQIYPDHRRLKPNGQQEGYVVLAEEERAKGFVRPVRRSYVHLKCNTETTMSQTIAETYARNPNFYNGTFCGEKIDVRFAEKIEAARSQESFKVGIVMDDKVITIEMPWVTIRSTSEIGLSEYILSQMREAREAAN